MYIKQTQQTKAFTVHLSCDESALLNLVRGSLAPGQPQSVVCCVIKGSVGQAGFYERPSQLTAGSILIMPRPVQFITAHLTATLFLRFREIGLFEGIQT